MVNRRRLAGLLLAVLLAAGCATTTYDKDQVTISTSDTAIQTTQVEPLTKEPEPQQPRGLRKYFRQTIDWLACDTGIECATINVPLDWAQPGSVAVPIALRRVPARQQAQGSIIVNPGGPGVSGSAYIDYARTIISDPVLDSLDVVSFDARGTGLSRRVNCYDDQQWDEYISRPYAPGVDGLTARREAVAEFGAACSAKMGDWLRYMDPISVARDMDLIRVLLGDDELNYLGYAYGSLIGSTYAALFPTKVGRMVLDGGIDPTVTPLQSALDQARAFERSLTAYVNYCFERQECPLTGTVEEAKAQVAALVEGMRSVPLPTDDHARGLTSTLAAAGIEYALYSDSRWPLLTSALIGAIDDGDGTQLMASADTLNGRDESGAYAGSRGQAFQAISCLSSRLSTSALALQELSAQLVATAPTMGPMLADSVVMCDGWPTAATNQREGDVTAEGSATILVIGTTGDPATPYEWSQSLVALLDNAALLTFDGQGHGAYGRSNACVASTVDDYLLANVIPATGATC